MLGFGLRTGPYSKTIRDLIATIRGGTDWRLAARMFNVSRATAEVAFLRYVVYPEWHEAKKDAEEYVSDEPSHSELELPPCPKRPRSASTRNS